MGREVKRVPIDFEWPLKEVWKGYVMPDSIQSIPCEVCGQQGVNAMTRVIYEAFYDSDGFGTRWTYEYGTAPDGSKADRPPWKITGDCRRWCDSLTQDEVDALVEHGRLYDFTHNWTKGTGWTPKPDAPAVTPEMVAEWNNGRVGHDAINRYLLCETRAKRLGIYGDCEACLGEGELWRDKKHKDDNENWSRTHPPEGNGWQMWEDTSEGSPISPVFQTAESLAAWLEESGASSFGRNTATYDQWLSMIMSGWAPSAVVSEGDIKSGVEAVSDPTP